MPIGVIINCLSVATGGAAGALLKKALPERLKKPLLLYFGFGAMAIGIVSVTRMDSLPVVVLSLIVGAILGELLNIDGNLKKLLNRIFKNKPSQDTFTEEKSSQLVAVIAIFCFSGTGIFGALNEGMTGDRSILLAKSALDFFTAAIFASSIGFAVSLVALPQLVIFTLLFFAANIIGPMLTPNAIGDFIALGGIITFMLGITISKIKEIKVLNCIPAFVIVLMISTLLSRIAS